MLTRCPRIIAIAALLLVAFPRLGFPCHAAENLPDILLIMPDQMRGDCMSAVGHPAVRTPQLDQLAAQGVLFRRAYSTCPSCIPARHAMMTGLYPQSSGVVGFRARPITCATMPQVLGRAGYVTMLMGREMHQVPAREPYGYQTQILGSTYAPDDDYAKYLKQVAPDTGGILKLAAKLGVTYNWWQAAPWPLAEEHHPTNWVVTQARQAIAQAPADRPLFLTASFYAPHPPLFPPKQYFDACLRGKLPPPAHGDWVDWKALSTKGDPQGQRVFLKGETLRAAQAGYFGLIEHLDEQVSSLIRDFKARSQAAKRPWVIVFTSDHGEMLGDHGYFRKCEPYEGSANIPFIIAGSTEMGFQPGLRSAQPVCLEDIMPTLARLAGAKCPAVDGVDLTSVLQGRRQEVRAWLHSEHAPCYSKAQAFHALCDGHFKYIWRPTDGAEQLFDLAQDPREERDLSRIASRQETLQRWRGRLVERLAGRPEGFSDGARLMPGRPYPPLHPPRQPDSTPAISNNLASTQDHVRQRDCLANCRLTFEKEKKGHVAFLGGSITEMDGYRPMVCEILKRRFPNTQFTFTNAGIASTCSTTGAFRLPSDVLGKGPVDLFFVEFAVNDDQDAHHARRECIRGMEGIVRQALRHNPSMDIVIVHFVNPEILDTIRAGKIPLTIAAHEDVAIRYGISTIDLAAEVAQRMTAGRLTWEQFGGTHPAPAGNAICAAMIDSLLAEAWQHPLAADAVKTARHLPEPLDPLSYDRARFVDPKQAQVAHGWKLEVPEWKRLKGGTRSQFTTIPLLCADQPGAELRLDFSGTAVGAYLVAGPDAGMLEARIDGGPPIEVNAYHEFSQGLHYPRTVMFSTDLKPGRHTLVLRVADKTRSSGHAARIVQFVAN